MAFWSINSTSAWKTAAAIIVLGAISRLLPHPYNFTPIGAMALFGGAVLTNRVQALLIPFLALWFSDLVLNNMVYPSFYPEHYNSFIWFGNGSVYLSFLLIAFLGMFLLKKITIQRLLGVSLLSSILFFLLTNFQTWATLNGMYPPTLAGLWTCYLAGLPFQSYQIAAPFGFLGNGIFGDLMYNFLFFGAYALIQRRLGSYEQATVS